MSQPTLWDAPARPTIEEQFRRFHRRNPEVYDQLVALARQAVNAQGGKVGMKQLFEVLRWERLLAGLPDEFEGYALNNNYTSRYARLIAEREPDLCVAFELRELKAR